MPPYALWSLTRFRCEELSCLPVRRSCIANGGAAETVKPPVHVVNDPSLLDIFWLPGSDAFFYTGITNVYVRTAKLNAEA